MTRHAAVIEPEKNDKMHWLKNVAVQLIEKAIKISFTFIIN